MKQEKICDAMNFIDDDLIERTDAVRHKKTAKPQGIRRGILAACLCLVLFGEILISKSSIGDLFFWRSGCSQITHDIVIANDMMYFSRTGDGVYIYYKHSHSTEKLADFDGVLTETASGIFLLDGTDGSLYKVTENTIVPAGKIESDAILIDVISDRIYYQVRDQELGYQIIETDLATGKDKKILLTTASHIQSQKILGHKLYYYIADYNEDEIRVLDLRTGEQEALYRFPANENNASNHVTFFEDVILIQTTQGLFSMGYNDREAFFLTEYTPITAALDYFENQIYFIVAIPLGPEEEYREALVCLDLESGEMKEITQLTEGGMTQTYTEIAICQDGYYYVNPAYGGGLYFHYFDGRDEIQISGKR